MSNEITVTKNGLHFQVIDDDLFHRPAGFDYWENVYTDAEAFVFEVYDKILSKEKDFLDIGAWIGPNTIYAARKARKVVAVEPDPVAFSFLKKNVSINNFENVLLIEKAFSSKEQVTINPYVELGDSMTRVIDFSEQNSETIFGIGIDELARIGDYSLIKIDIEGYESVVIPEFEKQLIELNIPMVLSLHTPFNPEGQLGHAKLVESLSKIYKNVEDGYDENIKIKNLPEGFGCFFLYN